MTHIFRITSVSLLDPCLLKKLPEKNDIFNMSRDVMDQNCVNGYSGYPARHSTGGGKVRLLFFKR